MSGTLIHYVSTPKFQFRAMPPAQMHGDTTGGVEWFVSTDGSDISGNTIRVTKMTELPQQRAEVHVHVAASHAVPGPARRPISPAAP